MIKPKSELKWVPFNFQFDVQFNSHSLIYNQMFVANYNMIFYNVQYVFKEKWLWKLILYVHIVTLITITVLLQV